jgi:hypothetical protein
MITATSLETLKYVITQINSRMLNWGKREKKRKGEKERNERDVPSSESCVHRRLSKEKFWLDISHIRPRATANFDGNSKNKLRK